MNLIPETIITYFADRELHRYVTPHATILEALWAVRHTLPADAMFISAECSSARWSRLIPLYNLQNVSGGGVQIYSDDQPSEPIFPNEGSAMETLRRYILRELVQGSSETFNAVPRPTESYLEFRNMAKPTFLPPPGARLAGWKPS